MNVQNAKELTIEEGDVRTIHDSDGKQLWGKLAYSTTYTGDTTQATYTGKNLLENKLTSTTINNVTATLNSDGSVKLTGTSNSSSNTWFIMHDNTFVLSAGTYTYSGGISSNVALYNDSFGAVTSSTTKTLTGSSSGNWSIRVAPNAATNVTVFPMVEVGSSPTTFEPYVGGMPSPNPAFPQTINVVTGTQTITLSDGEVSEDYTVALGTIELCKIGTYQDYIYKSGDDWYVHKATEKMTLNGSENWSSGGSGTQVRFFITLSDIALQAYDWNASIVTVSNAFVGTNWFQFYNTAIDNAMCSHDSSHYLMVRATQFNDTSAFKTWLQSNNVALYYALATPTDTQITDATLISQLEAIHEWLTRYGYQSSVVGSLPIIISQTNL